jgi:tripartite-type tricarboxylate transporter receptor subunit TctC
LQRSSKGRLEGIPGNEQLHALTAAQVRADNDPLAACPCRETIMSAQQFAFCVVAAMCLALPAPAAAQLYPEKPVRLIVPYPPGGPMDTLARFLSQPLSARLGQSIVIENRPGGGATLGTRSVVSAEPDGYTLLFASSGSLSIAPALYSNLDYDPISSFTPIASFAILQQLMVVRPDIPVTSVAEFVAYAKARPGKLNYGASLATPPHLLSTLFKVKAGIDSVYVPYKGSAPAVTDLLAGVTHWSIDGLPILAPLAMEGKLRPLAVASTQRWREMPQIPTLVEAGFPDVALDAWTGVVAPAGTSPAIVNRLSALINEGLAGEHVERALAKLGARPKISSPPEFAALIKTELPKWAYAVKLSGARID